MDTALLINSIGTGYADPTTISGLVAMWLPDSSKFFQDSSATTPAAVGDPVGAWVTSEGNSYIALQATTANKPTRTATGISFDGGDFLRLTTAAVVNLASGDDVPFTAFWHMEGTPTTMGTVTGWGGVTSYDRQSKGQACQRRDDVSLTVTSTFSPITGQVFSAYRMNGTTLDMFNRVGGVLSQVETATAWNVGTLTNTAFAIGGGATNTGATNRITGNSIIKAVYLYNRALTDAEMQQVYGYSIAKLGV